MTRKDYVLIAAAIAETVRIDHTPCARTIVDNIACYLKKDNSRFDRERFLEACGVSK